LRGIAASQVRALRTSFYKLKAMSDRDVEYVSDERGEPVAVLVPIALWREIESERETAKPGCLSRKPLRSLEFVTMAADEHR
jgi:hypothetical protein